MSIFIFRPRNDYLELLTLCIIDKLNVGICLQGTQNAASGSSVFQQIRSKGSNDMISRPPHAFFNLSCLYFIQLSQNKIISLFVLLVQCAESSNRLLPGHQVGYLPRYFC